VPITVFLQQQVKIIYWWGGGRGKMEQLVSKMEELI
jgi:hypothetical protein